MADDLDDVDVVFADVIENLNRGLGDQRFLEGRRPLRASRFEEIAVGLAHPDDRWPLMSAVAWCHAARQRIEYVLRRHRRLARLAHRRIDGADDFRVTNGLVDIDAVGP